MDRRNLIKSAVAASIGLTSGLAVCAINPQPQLFQIDEKYKAEQWAKIRNGEPKRGGLVPITREAMSAIRQGKISIILPKGHIVDIFDRPEEDTTFIKMWGDDLPIVHEGACYPWLIATVTRRG